MFRKGTWDKWTKINETLLNLDEKEVFNWSNSFKNNKKIYASCIKYIKSIKNHKGYKENFDEFLKYKENPNIPKTGGGVTYDKIYTSLKYNISIKEAEDIVNENKFKTAGSLESYIARYNGDIEKGTEAYNQFVKKSVKCLPTIESHGREFFKETSPRCKEYYMKKGYSENEAKKLVSAFQRKNSGVSRLYWIGKGYTKEETDEIMSAINAKKATGIDYYKSKYGENWEVEWDKRIKKLRKSLNACEPSAEKDLYYLNVYRITNRSIQKYKNNIKNYELRGVEHGYDLDHIFSVKMGFLLGIAPEVIGHITNLRIIDASYNRQKQDKCDKSFSQLIEDYNEYESTKETSNR